MGWVDAYIMLKVASVLVWMTFGNSSVNFSSLLLPARALGSLHAGIISCPIWIPQQLGCLSTLCCLLSLWHDNVIRSWTCLATGLPSVVWNVNLITPRYRNSQRTDSYADESLNKCSVGRLPSGLLEVMIAFCWTVQSVHLQMWHLTVIKKSENPRNQGKHWWRQVEFNIVIIVFLYLLLSQHCAMCHVYHRHYQSTLIQSYQLQSSITKQQDLLKAPSAAYLCSCISLLCCDFLPLLLCKCLPPQQGLGLASQRLVSANQRYDW